MLKLFFLESFSAKRLNASLSSEISINRHLAVIFNHQTNRSSLSDIRLYWYQCRQFFSEAVTGKTFK